MRTLRGRLAWKLLASYMVVVLVGVVVLAGTAELLAPSTLQSHVDRMAALEGAPVLVGDLHDSFHSSVEEILFVATIAALAAAVVVSLFTTRRITGPVRKMAIATRHIAAGEYRRRLDADGEDELAELARAFNLLAESLEQTERRRMALISDVAHELRTPLTNLRGLVESVADGVVQPGPDMHVAMGAEVARMQRLVGDLEELSRAEAGALRLEWEDTDMAQVARGCVERLRGQFASKGVDLVARLPAAPAMVRGDAGRLTQILMNLVGNALQYTPRGGVVRVTLETRGDRVWVAVADTGIGISEADL
ncbi:MAG: sensor histidine kinase, partial [Anaerolineae bacterium]